MYCHVKSGSSRTRLDHPVARQSQSINNSLVDQLSGESVWQGVPKPLIDVFLT